MKILYKNKWLSLAQADNGKFIYAHKPTNSVAVLPYKPVKFLLRSEPHHPTERQNRLCAITGGIEKEETPLRAAVREVREESGYICNPTDMQSLGVVFPSKFTNNKVHLFVVNVENSPWEESKGDGTDDEKMSSTVWASSAGILACDDPVAHSIYVKFLNTRLNKLQK